MPGRQEVAVLRLKQIYEIAKVKQQDMPDTDLESICKMVASTAKSMGIRAEQRVERTGPGEDGAAAENENQA